MLEFKQIHVNKRAPVRILGMLRLLSIIGVIFVPGCVSEVVILS